MECVKLPDRRYRGSIEDVSRATDCINSVQRYPVINERFRGVIEPLAGDEIQFIPMELVSGGERLIGNWWVVNFLHRVECINYEVTEYTDNLKKNKNYLDIVVHLGKIPSSLRFFRVNGFLRAQYVHASVRAAIRKAKLRTAYWAPLRCSDLGEQPPLSRRSM